MYFKSFPLISSIFWKKYSFRQNQLQNDRGGLCLLCLGPPFSKHWVRKLCFFGSCLGYHHCFTALWGLGKHDRSAPHSKENRCHLYPTEGRLGGDRGMQNQVQPHGGQQCSLQNQERKLLVRKFQCIHMYVNIYLSLFFS